MTTTTTSMPRVRKSLGRHILLTGLLAGTLDALAASIQFYSATGKSPAVVWKFVASGFFGTPAFGGGGEMVMAGILFHYLFAFTFTVLFVLLYPRLGLERVNKWVLVLVYGVLVWGTMYFVVELSRVPAQVFHWDKALVAAGIIVVCIGAPVVLLTRRYFSVRR